MATMGFAMWLQAPDIASTNHLIMIFIGILAISILAIAITVVILAVMASKTIKHLTAVVEKFTAKAYPLIDTAAAIGKSGQAMLLEATPKVKQITDNVVKVSESLVATGKVAESVLRQCDATISDANLKAQKQVARVDGMVTTALTTTSEVVGTINHGIRVPAQKIAALATDAKFFAEGLFAKIKSMAAGTPFGGR